MTRLHFRAGVVGAGSRSELHILAANALPRLVELVGVADRDLPRTETIAKRLGTTAYPSLEALVAAGANVVHVLTPPSEHAPVALAALELGCHVLIDPPVSEEPEAKKIAELAKRKGLVVCVNHPSLFDPHVRRALDFVRAGKLGEVVSVEILRGSEYPPYEGGPLPPWYRSAGYAYRDLAVDCMHLLRELIGPLEAVEGEWRSLGGDPNLAFDEWITLVSGKRGVGRFQLTWNHTSMQSHMLIHGTKGVRRVDLAMLRGEHSATPIPKAKRLVNALTDSIRLVDVPVSGRTLVRKDVRAFQGLRGVVGAFYRSLHAGTPPPVGADDAVAILPFVEQVARAAEADHAARVGRFRLSDTTPIVVTGASGALGRTLVNRLVAQGKQVRMFVRRIPERSIEGVEYCFGNLGDPAAVDRAVGGADTVVHVGASMKGGWAEHLGGTVVGTQNVLDSCKKHGIKQLVHISSMSVVDWAGSSGLPVVAEDAALEPRADERGAYTRAKLEAERKVTEAARAGLRCVILRPGQIFGGGIPLVNGAVARRAGRRWLVLGDGTLELPLVYIDDVVDAILAAMDRKLTSGEIIHIIDDTKLTQTDVLDLAGGGASVIKVPRSAVFALGKLSELPLGRRSPIALYRLQSALARLHCESDRAQRLLGWRPRVGIREGIRREMATIKEGGR